MGGDLAALGADSSFKEDLSFSSDGALRALLELLLLQPRFCSSRLLRSIYFHNSLKAGWGLLEQVLMYSCMDYEAKGVFVSMYSLLYSLQDRYWVPSLASNRTPGKYNEGKPCQYLASKKDDSGPIYTCCPEWHGCHPQFLPAHVLRADHGLMCHAWSCRQH